jgi:hypothetical protein
MLLVDSGPGGVVFVGVGVGDGSGGASDGASSDGANAGACVGVGSVHKSPDVRARACM